MKKKAIKAMVISALTVSSMNTMVSFAEENIVTNNAGDLQINTKSTTKGQTVNVSVSLNVRKSTSTSSTIMGKIPANATFDVISKSGTWYKIKYGTIEGYVSGEYVKIISNSTSTGGSTSGGTTSGGSTSGGNTSSGNNNTGNSGTSGSTQTIGKGQTVNVSVSLNVRKSTSTSSVIMGKIPANATFDVISKSGTWYKIKYGTIEGYVSGEYVKIISNSTSTGGSTNNGTTSGGSTSGGNTSSGNNTGNSGTSGTTQTIGKGQTVNVSVSLNVRQSTSTSSAIMGKIPANATFDIISKSGTWYKIKYGTIEGYVSGEYVKLISDSTDNNTGNSTGGNNTPDNNTPVKEEVLTNTYGLIIGLKANETLNIRQEPNTSSKILGSLNLLQKVKLEAKAGAWYKVSVNGVIGYISSGYVQIVNESSTEIKDVDANKYQEVFKILSTQIGSPYVYGGAGEIITQSLIESLQKLYPNQSYSVPEEFFDSTWRAFDCSGFMQWGFGQAGVKLGRNTSAQINNGVEVTLDKIQPGDLLFYSTVNHVGMYIGNNQWIESPRTGLNVRITTVPWDLIGRARRVI